jgi:hypothetical protein
MAEARLEVRLDLPERATSGAPLDGRLTIANAGDEPISVLAPSGPAVLTLVLFDRFWNVVEPAPVAKVHVAPERTELAPGESLDAALPGLSFLSGTAQMQYSPAAGTYYVIAVYHPGTDRLPDRSSYPLVAVSNVARLELAEQGA